MCLYLIELGIICFRKKQIAQTIHTLNIINSYSIYLYEYKKHNNMSKERIIELKQSIERVKEKAASYKAGQMRFIAVLQDRKKMTGLSKEAKQSINNEIAAKKAETKRWADGFKREIDGLKAAITRLK